jgi:hypothetical protein
MSWAPGQELMSLQAVPSTRMTESKDPSETLVFLYHATWRNISQDRHLNLATSRLP